MPYMCDALLPIEQRYASEKFRRLSRWFNPYQRLRDELVEVRAMLLTPGMERQHVFALMHWDINMVRMIQPLHELDEEARPLAEANVAAVSQADGEALLRAILDFRPSWGERVPLWATRGLQALRRQGLTARDVARRFGVSEAKVRRWWSADDYDPLTARFLGNGEGRGQGLATVAVTRRGFRPLGI